MTKRSATGAKPSWGVEETAEPFVTRFMAKDGAMDLDSVTRIFGMTRGQLAETAGLARDTLQKAARRDAPKTRARLTEMLEIIGRVQAWAGGQPQAMAWYRAQPIAALDGRTAEALVKSGKATLVRDYLDHIATGGFA
jgi:DNA-binding phage protein